MPRKGYTARNRYVWNARHSEGVFLLVLSGWCEHLSATETAQSASEWARANGHKPVTRETVSRYFIDLGVHLWVVSALSGFLRGQKRFPPGSIEARNWVVVQLFRLFEIVSERVDPGELRGAREEAGMFWSADADMPIAALMHEFKQSNGFSVRWIHAYAAREFVLCPLVTDDGLKPEGAIEQFFGYMVSFLEKYPLRKPFPKGEFLWSEGWENGLDWFLPFDEPREQ